MSHFVIDDVTLIVNGERKKAKAEIKLLDEFSNLDHSSLTVHDSTSLVVKYNDISEPIPNTTNIYLMYIENMGLYKINCSDDPKKELLSLGKVRGNNPVLLACCDIYTSIPVIEWMIDSNRYHKNNWVYFSETKIQELISLMRKTRYPDTRNNVLQERKTMCYRNVVALMYPRYPKDEDSKWKFKLFNKGVVGQYVDNKLHLVTWPLKKEDDLPSKEIDVCKLANNVSLEQVVVTHAGNIIWIQDRRLYIKRGAQETCAVIGLEGEAKLIKYKPHANSVEHGIIATLNDSDSIRTWHTGTLECITSHKYTPNVYDFDVMNNGNIITCSPAGVIIWCPLTGKEVTRLKSDYIDYRRVIVLSDTKILLYTNTPWVSVWNLDPYDHESLKCAYCLHPETHDHVVIDKDTVVSWSNCNYLIVWDALNACPIKSTTLDCHKCSKILYYGDNKVVVASTCHLYLVDIKALIKDKTYCYTVLYKSEFYILDFCITEKKNICITLDRASDRVITIS